MSTDLAPLQHSVRDLEVMASKVAKSRLFSMDESQAFTLMLLCQSRGIHPIEAVMRFDIIQGRPAMKADAMLAEFQRLGGTVEWVSDNDNPDYQEAVFSHPKLCPKPKRVKFSMKDATRAGVNGKDNWKKYPASMLRARVVSNALRMVSPGIVSGIYTPEEVQDFDPPKRVEAKVEPPAVAVKSEAEVRDWAARKVEEQTAKYRPAEPPGPPQPVAYKPKGESLAKTREQWAAMGVAAPDRPTAEHEPIAPGEEPYQAYLFAATMRANDYWELLHTTGGMPAPEPCVNMFQVENHLGSWLEKQGRVKPDYLLANGVRSRAKLKTCLGKWFAKYREEFERLTEEYLEEKLEEAAKQAGLVEDQGPDDYDVPAEVVSAVDGN
jgi:hypothetical protein